MTERVIAGVKVPLVGDDERMHRAINRSIDDLKKLKTEIASTGVATAKQAREVMVLEERISSMVRAQDKASSTFGSGASRLGQMKEKVSSVAGAMSGLAGSVGQAGGALGRFSSVGAQVFGSLAVGGPVAAGVLAVGAGVALLGQHMSDTRAKAEAFGTAIDEAILTRRQESIAALEALREKVAAIGKTAGQASKDLLEMKRTAVAADAIMGRGHLAQLESRSMSHGMNKPPWYASAEAKIAWQQEKQRLAEAIESQKKMVAFDTQTLADLDEQIKLTAIVAADEGKRAAAAHKTQKAHEATVQALSGQLGVAQALADQRRREGKVQIDPTTGGPLGMGFSTGSQFGGPMGPARSGAAWTAGQIDAHGLERAMSRGAKMSGREFVQTAFGSMLSSGSPFSGAGGMAAGIATSIADTLANALKQGFNALASAVGGGVDFLLGSSKFGGMGGSAAGVASSVFAGHAAVSMAAGPLSAVTGGPVRGAMLAGAAGGASMLPEMMMRATLETKSYAQTMHAMNGIFKGTVMVMEPVFASLAPSIGLVGMLFRNLAQDLAPFTAVMGEVFGDALFKGVRGLALTAVNAAVGVSSLHIGAMRAAAGFNLLAAQTFNNLGMFETGATFFEAYLLQMGATEEAMNKHGDLLGTRAEVEGMVAAEGQNLFDALAYLGEGVFDLGDATSDVASSMRNIPDFFNVARARRDSGATSTAPGPSITQDIADASKGLAGGGFSVNDGGLYVNTLVVPSENPQQLAMRLMHASYTTSGRQVGSGEPSRTSSYRNGDY